MSAPARPIPATIGIVFGALWGLIGAQALPAAWRMPAAIACGVVGLVLVVRLWTVAATGDARPLFARRAYIVAVVLEVVAIYAASALLPRFGWQDWFIQTVGVIVGLHFIGLWVATRSSRFLGIAAGMCLVSGASIALPHPLRDMVTGFGNALVLWIGASGGATRLTRP